MKSFFRSIFAAAIVALVATSCANEPNGGGKFKIGFLAENGSAKAFVGDKEVTRAGAGDIVTVRAEADKDYHFTGWSSNPESGFDDRLKPETSFMMPAGDVVITAGFSKDAYNLAWEMNLLACGTVTVSVDGVAISNGAAVEMGKTVAVKATEAAGHKFMQWLTEPDVVFGTVGDEALETTFTMPAGTVALLAVFDVQSYPLTFAANPAEGGEVVVGIMSGEDDLVLTSGDLVPFGSVLGAVYRANTDWVFTGWSSDEITLYEADKTKEELLCTMPAKAATLTANFAKIPKYAINITPPSNGTLSVTVDGNEVTSGTEYLAGVEVLISATPDKGWLFKEWSKSPASLDVISTGTGIARFFVPEQAVTIGATFEAEPEEDFVQIGDTKWAKYNVGEPGKFVEKITDYGLFYQFNYSVGWSWVSGAGVSVPSDGLFYKYNAEPYGWGTVGALINDHYGQGPCPDGYTVPTRTQHTALRNACDESKTLPGAEFPGVTYTVKGGTASVFFPWAGYMSGNQSAVNPSVVGREGHYWTSQPAGGWTGTGQPPMSYKVKFSDSSVASETTAQRGLPHSIRCVKVE